MNNDVLEEIINIDNKIMRTNITTKDIELHMHDTSNLHLEDSLIITDGNPFITLKLINSNIKSSVLYPNHSFLALNKYLLKDNENIYLALEENDFKYEKAASIFKRIILINSKDAYLEYKKIYPTIEYIEM